MGEVNTIILWISGLLQLIVAAYALRLNRLFGTAQAGWSLFCAFLLLALLHTVRAAAEARPTAQFTLFAEVIYALISLLLLLGVVHVEAVWRERQRFSREEHRLRLELEAEVQKQTAYLTTAIDGLQAEMAERKRMEAEVDTAHWELNAVSNRAELVRTATDVLTSVGELTRRLESGVNLVFDHVKQSKMADVVQMGRLVRERSEDWASFTSEDPRGKKLANSVAELAEHLATEQTGLLAELESLRANLKNMAMMQQDYARLAGIKTLALGPDIAGRSITAVVTAQR